MFVFSKRYDAAVERAIQAEARAKAAHERAVLFERNYEDLRKRWNHLVDRINTKGGEEFLNSSPLRNLQDSDIRKMLMLCHPDKHDGKQMAVEVTAKLNAIRNQK